MRDVSIEMLLELHLRGGVYQRSYFGIHVPVVNMQLTNVLTLKDDALLPFVTVKCVLQNAMTYVYKIMVQASGFVLNGSSTSDVLHDALINASWRRIGGEPRLALLPVSAASEFPVLSSMAHGIYELELGGNINKALMDADILTVAHLMSYKDVDLVKVKGIGPRRLHIINRALTYYKQKWEVK